MSDNDRQWIREELNRSHARVRRGRLLRRVMLYVVILNTVGACLHLLDFCYERHWLYLVAGVANIAAAHFCANSRRALRRCEVFDRQYQHHLRGMLTARDDAQVSHHLEQIEALAHS